MFWHSSVQYASMLKSLIYLVFSKSCQKSTFITNGFGHWGKVLKRFEGHEISDTHKEAVSKIVAITTFVPISTRLSEQCASAKSDIHFQQSKKSKLLWKFYWMDTYKYNGFSLT